MRVLVTSGWEYTDRPAVFAALDAIHSLTPIEVVIEGGDRGAQALAASWARVREVSSWRVPANPADGRRSVERRNARMLAMCAPTIVLAFPGDDGSVDLAIQAADAGVSVRDGLADPRQVSIFDTEDLAA